MNNAEEQLRILKNLIMSKDYITQRDLQKVVIAMEDKKVEKRPQQPEGVETR